MQRFHVALSRFLDIKFDFTIFDKDMYKRRGANAMPVAKKPAAKKVAAKPAAKKPVAKKK